MAFNPRPLAPITPARASYLSSPSLHPSSSSKPFSLRPPHPFSLFPSAAPHDFNFRSGNHLRAVFVTVRGVPRGGDRASGDLDLRLRRTGREAARRGGGGGRDGEGGRVRDRGLGGERIGIKEEGRGIMGLGGRAMDGGWGVAYSARGSTMS